MPEGRPERAAKGGNDGKDMLTQLRSAAGTWVAKLLLILLVLSFAVWGISGQIMGGAGNAVVTAGNTTVSILEYRLAYDRQIAVLSQQFGTRLTREQAQALGVDQQVLGQLVAGAVLDEQAREMRLGVSSDRVAELTALDPAFRGPDGRFDRQQFEYALRQIGMRAEDYFRSREQVAIRQQIVEAVSDGIQVPSAFLEAVALYNGEDRTVDYIVLAPALVEPIEAPSDAQLTEFFEERQPEYAAPEYRAIDYVKLEPVDITDPASVTDEQAREYYDGNLQRYTTAERRTIDQLVFADREAAEAAAQRIADGASFDDIVAEQGRSAADVRLGTFEQSRMPDAAIAEAAFALDAGGVSGVVDGAFGPVIVRVSEITPESVRGFEEVSAEIRDELALDEANRILLDVYDAYEDARAGGASMQEAASAQRLQVVSIPAVDRSGRTPEGDILSDLPESSQLLRESFEAEPGDENPAINIGSAGYLFYEVRDVTAARDRTLDEVRDEVVADWTAEQRAERLATRAAELQGALRDGRELADIAEELEIEVQTRRGLTRDSEDAGLGEAGVAAAFGVANGGTGVVTSPDGESQIVFEVTEVIAPAAAGSDAVPEATRRTLASGLADDLLDQLVARLQEQYPVTIDQAAIRAALSF